MLKRIKFFKILFEIIPLYLFVLALAIVVFGILYSMLNKGNLSDKKKSILLTLYTSFTLLLLLFTIRFWPPSDREMALLEGGGGGGGMEINFGDSDVGKGDNYTSKVLDIKDTKTVETITETAQPEEIITQDNPNDATQAVVHKVIKPEKVKPNTKPITKPIEPTKPKVNNNANDALANILGGKNKGGDGNDSRGGNKGSANGSTSSNGYYGNGGSGGGTGGGNGSGNGTGSGAGSGSGSGGGNGSGIGTGSGYSLGNRKALTKPQPNYTCNEQGVVVVQISVDRNGNVVDAKPGARGTTNSASCLYVEAKNAALKTKWQPSADALEKQVGTIRYNFSIRD